MRHRLLIVCLLVSNLVAALGASPPRPVALSRSAGRMALEPVLHRNSILHVRPLRIAGGPLSVRLVDEEAGTAYVGMGTHAEPELSTEDLLDDELTPAVPPLSSEVITGEAIPLDGAAAEAEKPPAVEKQFADSRSSFGWIAGTGNQLGMLEWVDRDLAIFDYSFNDRATFHAEPGFAMRWLTGPDTTDLPPYLFSIAIDFGLGLHPSENWSMDVVVSPSWNTDFANKSADLFRLPWQVVNTWKLDDEWKLVMGTVDLDREDIHLLPVAGVIFRPLDGSREWDLVFPRPKAAQRLTIQETSSTWCYVSGEMGGGSFSIQRPGAVHDIVTLRDFRLLVGWESRRQKRHASRIEAGWVFGRAVEYASGVGDYNPGQTAMIRLSSDY